MKKVWVGLIILLAAGCAKLPPAQDPDLTQILINDKLKEELTELQTTVHQQQLLIQGLYQYYLDHPDMSF